MSGNEAIARGVYEAGCSVAAAYPGTPSTEILENIGALYKKDIYSEHTIRRSSLQKNSPLPFFAGRKNCIYINSLRKEVQEKVFEVLLYCFRRKMPENLQADAGILQGQEQVFHTYPESGIFEKISAEHLWLPL